MEFRGYDFELEMMLSHEQLMTKQYPTYNPLEAKYDIFNSKKLNIMMYSGFKDKDKIKIYESDILETDESKRYRLAYCVEFNKSYGMFLAVPFMKGRGSSRIGINIPNNPVPLYKFVKQKPKIIGNKYEHPELIDRRLS